jgi:carbon storage regulator
MLVLSRRLGESIVLGDDVVITVLAVAGGRTRLGIEAPRSVPIQRAELEPRARPIAPPPAERLRLAPAPCPAD